MVQLHCVLRVCIQRSVQCVALGLRDRGGIRGAHPLCEVSCWTHVLSAVHFWTDVFACINALKQVVFLLGLVQN